MRKIISKIKIDDEECDVVTETFSSGCIALLIKNSSKLPSKYACPSVNMEGLTSNEVALKAHLHYMTLYHMLVEQKIIDKAHKTIRQETKEPILICKLKQDKKF